MREIVHLQAGQCGNQIGAKVSMIYVHGKCTLDEIRSRRPEIYQLISVNLEHRGLVSLEKWVNLVKSTCFCSFEAF